MKSIDLPQNRVRDSVCEELRVLNALWARSHGKTGKDLQDALRETMNASTRMASAIRGVL